MNNQKDPFPQTNNVGQARIIPNNYPHSTYADKLSDGVESFIARKKVNELTKPNMAVIFKANNAFLIPLYHIAKILIPRPFPLESSIITHPYNNRIILN